MKKVLYFIALSFILILQSCNNDEQEIISTPDYAQQAREMAQKHGMRFETDHPEDVTPETLCQLDSLIKVLTGETEEPVMNEIDSAEEDSFAIIMNRFFPTSNED